MNWKILAKAIAYVTVFCAIVAGLAILLRNTSWTGSWVVAAIAFIGAVACTYYCLWDSSNKKAKQVMTLKKYLKQPFRHDALGNMIPNKDIWDTLSPADREDIQQRLREGQVPDMSEYLM